MGVWLKRAALLAVFVAIAGGILLALKPKPVAVDIAEVSSGPLTETVNEEGIVRIREVYAVSAPYAGRVERSPLEIGDTVIAGRTLVATMRAADPPFIDARSRRELSAIADAAESAVRLAEAEVRQAEAELAQAAADLARAEQLFARRTISEKSVEQARTGVATGEAQVRRAEANLALRRSQLTSAKARLIQPGQDTGANEGADCCITLRAPTSGVVLSVPVESEQVVPTGTTLAEIGDPEDLEIVVDLLSSDAVRVKPGSRVIVTEWGGNRDLEGIVRRIDPVGFTKVSALGIEEQRVNTRIELIRNDAQRLGHNYRVFVRIVVWESEEAVRVPLGALFRSRNEWAVFVLANGTASLRIVQVGHRNDVYAETLAGLEPGEQVVLHPSDAVEDGVAAFVRAVENE